MAKKTLSIIAPTYANREVSVGGVVVAFAADGIGTRIVRRGQIPCDEPLDEATCDRFAAYPAAFTVAEAPTVEDAPPAPTKRAKTAPSPN